MCPKTLNHQIVKSKTHQTGFKISFIQIHEITIIQAHKAWTQSLKTGDSHFLSSINEVITKITDAKKNQINGFEIGKIIKIIIKKIIGIIIQAGYGIAFLLYQKFSGLSINQNFGKNFFTKKIKNKVKKLVAKRISRKLYNLF